jgi:polyisoprenoid-binding protein YceI
MRNFFKAAKPFKALLAAGALLPLLLGAPACGAAPEAEQLIVFVQPGLSEVDRVFSDSQLPAIGEVASAMGVPLHVVAAGNGAPAEVAITPLIVYQNHRGRSVYQGRTTTPGRIRNFMRTSRFVPQGEAPNRRERIPVWSNGRSQTWAPLKVASVTGTQPAGYRHEAFLEEALESIGRGLTHFQFQPAADLGRADRGFYMDFYPWLSPEGTLYLSMALYSQFHCKAPIFEKKQDPLVGPWKERRKLFEQAAALMEAAVVRQIRSPETGDAFDPVADTLPSASWEQIGFPLPAAPSQAAAESAFDVALARVWTLEKPGPDDPPMIQFRFASPLDNYAGEVKDAAGQFSLVKTLALEGTTGLVEIDTRSAVTMGEPVLDEAIRGSALLGVRTFPHARFVVEAISSDGQPLSYGRLTPAAVTGTFTLKGTSVPLAVVAEFEPVIGADGGPRLLVRTAFQIDLRTFDIEGADGPEPAKYTLLLDVNLKLKPAPGE